MNFRTHRFLLSIMLLVASVFGNSCKKPDTPDPARKMREFVVNIARYARQQRPDFIIIPQNGLALCFENLEPEDAWAIPYFQEISGVGVEELFYNGQPVSDPTRLRMARRIREHHPVLCAEYVSDSAMIPAAFAACDTNGFLCFVRSPANYDYHRIPDTIPHVHPGAVTTLTEAQNFLYLISYDAFPSADALVRALDATPCDLMIIEPFFGRQMLSPAQIQALQTKPDGRRRLVIAYCNIGAAEKWRYYWKDEWRIGHPAWLKKPYDGYPDEIWVEYWHPQWQDIIWGNDSSYIHKILDAGFDGAYLDNVEAYYFLYHE